MSIPYEIFKPNVVRNDPVISRPSRPTDPDDNSIWFVAPGGRIRATMFAPTPLVVLLYHDYETEDTIKRLIMTLTDNE